MSRVGPRSHRRLHSANSSMLLVTSLAAVPPGTPPAQTWSEANFVIHPEVSDRPWSHDRSAVEAAISRRSQHKQQPESLVLTERPDGPCTIADLRHAFGQPIRTFCEDRLHLAALQEFGASAGRTSRSALMDSIATGYVTACCHLPWVEEIQKTGSISLPHQVTFLPVCTEPHHCRQHETMQRQ